ncbi:hypothetical protein [Mucilaginibacter polytrichastri]|uniref:Uncharacterized protein n=1 Tax=Mucilaginibacter polytrichastri TaxID=1302689 RepID=A0A1Q6A014_9SPHI|nr:hypothetical protein [Mucilaginibacter polytrichastri]OKS87355.1 hypothetical protein RG47T_2816 [Mucilaginibacter polytrichastri]SFT21993.1 hypothetical protein SAMN04487890_11854 [Mucilaginibacter polytrichastri]
MPQNVKYWLLIVIIIAKVEAKSISGLSTDELNIQIEANSSVSNNHFKINIRKKHNIVNIAYSILDSIRYSALHKDTAYMRIIDEFKKGKSIKDSVAKKLFDDLVERNSVYKRDLIVANLKSDKAYDHLLGLMMTSSKEELENKEQNKSRIILDDTYVKYTVNISSQTKIALAHSPSQISNPLLYQLLTQTLNLCREKHRNNFLDKGLTSGY